MFANRVAQLLRPGGLFILMTQNPFVWNRSSRLSKKDDRQIRNWPPLGRLRELLDNQFSVLHVSSIVPGGDQGVLQAREQQVRRVARFASWSASRATALYEDWLIGRELIVIGKRV